MSGLEGLTPEVLTRLYCEKNFTDAQIAKQFGTYQVKVSRLRKKWGIDTVLKSDRLDLPGELTSRQHSILLGSMLGDGGLRVTGSSTAGYTESHCDAQEEYLDWKVQEWGSFYSSKAPVQKGSHKGFRFFTHGCRVLFPYWQKFYPSGVGGKVFSPWLVAEVDALALAVWFMDDGSRTSSYFRFSVGPDGESQQVQLDVLRKFGVIGRLYQAEGDAAIHITNRTDLTKFVDVVAPHMHSSMMYKLELLKKRSMGVAPRHALTSEKLTPLVDRGLSAAEISRVFGVSSQSVCRAFDRMGVVRKVGRPKKDSRKEYSREAGDTLLAALLPVVDVDKAVGILLNTEIPLKEASEEELLADKRLLLNARTTLSSEGSVHSITKGGTLICNTFFPHRLDARYRTNPSMREAWYMPDMLRRAVKFQLSVGDPVTVSRVFRALQVVVRAPTNFRPCIAKAVVERYSPQGGLVLDPCAGYGGRALGTLAAGRSYVGVDPNSQAPSSFEKMSALLGGSLHFHNVPYEDVVLDGVQADLVFTSPPYFSVERYEGKATQSWVRYKTWPAWVEGFLVPFVVNSWNWLRPGGHFVVNTKTVKYGKNSYDIPSEVNRLAAVVGFEHVETLALSIGRVGKNAQNEPLLVYRKSTSG